MNVRRTNVQHCVGPKGRGWLGAGWLLAMAVAVLTLAAERARAEVTLPRLFGDHMVLQRDCQLPVWGKAEPGEAVRVELAGHEASTRAGDDGRWSVRLPALKAGGPHKLTVRGKNEIVLNDVLIGEVWVCSGQSNMEWSMRRGLINVEKERAAANDPQLRLFHVKRAKADKPADDVEGQWQLCTPETVFDFSAVAYFFGRHLRKHLGVPVGLIESAWGGTPAEYWTPLEMFENDPSLYEVPDDPRSKKVMQTPSVLFNGMIAPLIPYAMRGVIWYQGESNVPRGAQYGKLFSAMIEGWRRAWGEGDFPFLYVQIAPWNYSRNKNPAASEGAALVRQGQLETLRLPNTAMVVTTDIGDVNDIHPRNKQEVGRRLGLAARAIAYGEQVVYSGPLPRSLEVRDGRAIVHFDHVDGGLVAKGGALREFEIAGPDGKFVPAEAEIVGDTVVVHADGVSQPVAVRMGWRDVAEPNLFNAEGLPASPFRLSVETTR